MRIMVISPVKLSRDCLTAVLGSMHPVPEVVSAVSITALHDRSPSGQPDVVLVDVTQEIGMGEVALVAAKWPNLPLLALGLPARRDEVVRHGFVGHVARDATIQDLQSAISDAVAGRTADIAGGLIRALPNRQHPSTPRPVAAALTNPETGALRTIASFPSGANMRTRGAPDHQIAEAARAANSQPVDPIPGPSTVGRDKSGVPSAKGVEWMDSSHVATGAITALLATALVYLSNWPLQALDPPTASAFAGLLVAAGAALVKYYQSRTALPAPPVVPVVPIAPLNLVREPPIAA